MGIIWKARYNQQSIKKNGLIAMTKQNQSKKTKKPHYFGIYLLALFHQTDLWVKWHTHWFPRQQPADNNGETQNDTTKQNEAQ